MIAEEERAGALWRTESQMLPVGGSPSGLVSWWNGCLLSKVTTKDISHIIPRLPNCYTIATHSEVRIGAPTGGGG